MLKIAVCDDESHQRIELIDMIKKALQSKHTQYYIYQYENGEELFQSNLKINLFF